MANGEANPLALMNGDSGGPGWERNRPAAASELGEKSEVGRGKEGVR
jgi:hypothetical protein